MRAVFPRHEEELSLVRVELQVVHSRPSAGDSITVKRAVSSR